MISDGQAKRFASEASSEDEKLNSVDVGLHPVAFTDAH
jgi:hypothetical protein